MKPINFNKSGRIVLRKYNADGSLGDPIKSVAEVQSIQPSVNIKTSELALGNSNWPLIFNTGVGGTFQVTMAQFDPVIYGALMGDTAATGTADMMTDLEHVIDVTQPLTLTPALKTGGTLIILDNTGSPFVPVETTPSASGQYKITGSTIEWASADNGKSVLITWNIEGNNVVSTALKDNAVAPKFNATIIGKAIDADNNLYECNIIIDKCMVQGDIAMPQMQTEPATWNFTLAVTKPRAGRNPVSVLVRPVS